MTVRMEGGGAPAEGRPSRRACLLLFGLASLLPLLSACNAGCSSKGGSAAAACQQRQDERAAVRDRNRGWGR